MKIGVECGQRWWRLSSWRRWSFFEKKYWWDVKPRKFKDGSGFAIGPIMFWKEK